MLRCIARYTSSLGTYEPGGPPIRGTPEFLAALLRDSPGSFEPYPPPAPLVEPAAVVSDSGDDAATDDDDGGPDSEIDIHTTALDAPPEDRMMRAPTHRKNRRGRG